MIVSPNHIFVPVAYLGAVGSGRIFSGANPSYTPDGRKALCQSCCGDCVQVSNPVVPSIGSLQIIQTDQLGQLLCFSMFAIAMESLLCLSCLSHLSLELHG